jgi:hypothetical protein
MSNSQRMHACGAGARPINWPAKLNPTALLSPCR